MSLLNVRALATEKTMNKFGSKKYQLGQADCARMIIFHLHAMGCPVWKVSNLQKYNGPISAARAVKAATGFESLPAAMNSQFAAIPPAAALIGDIISFESDLEIGALGIAIGMGAAMAYEFDHEYPVTGRIIKAQTAWRII